MLLVLIIKPRYLVCLMLNSDFFISAYRLAFCSLLITFQTCSLCSSLLLEQIRISSRQVVQKSSKQSKRISFMYCWKVARLFVSPNGTTLYLQHPYCVQKVVRSLDARLICTQWNTQQMSNLVKIFTPPIQARVSLKRGIRYWSFQVIAFSLQQLIQKYRPPFAFYVKRIGAANRAQLLLINPLLRLSIRYYLQAYSSSRVWCCSGLNLRLVASFSSSIFRLQLQCSARISKAALKKKSFRSLN